ncbi:NOP5/NOP56 family protein [Candidatus Nanohalobium constans]|uniref:rRNA biogenesis protein Nop56/Nop58 n=1 Tax=Candidatus Nanohalobium constans TaxID=2565781 RepID=A0A5Q0UF31_9ARCH|nr:NOP5/NOP56 family protein [Candidatus Nanohalobium constans]QGA80156.1 rRNA biogenesis protein Nop56/Nop58 [Candidatus Nanohalobium constans]
MDKEEIRKKALKDTREELEEIDKIKLLMKAVKTLDQLQNNQYKEMESFRDWYNVHFPELEQEIEDDSHLLKILSDTIEKDNLDAFSELAESSTGMHLEKEDKQILEQFATSLNSKQEFITDLEDYVEKIAKQEMQNLSILLGPVLAARITHLAGGLENLAKKPASTIQMLGAEKALFRFLREGGNPPKHGVLFKHEYVSPLHPDKRGKMARFLANKAAIAARLDQYGDKNKGEDLREECREKYEEVEQE